MNPPFAATKDRSYALECADIANGNRKVTRHVPLEAAFVYRAIELLEEGGRLLAVLPCSVVMSDKLQWLRDELLSRGAIKFVHELPPRSFPGVESRIYLMVFKRGARQKQIALLNHDLHEPEKLMLSLGNSGVTRLDFGYASAIRKLQLLKEYSRLQWIQLRHVADVLRGDVASPMGPRCAVHSTDYSDGFWHTSDRHDESVARSATRTVRKGDLLMARVGRNACQTAGRGRGITGMACSDCVLIIRPKDPAAVLEILFALRIILALEWSNSLLERGTGASYVSHNGLLELLIPMNACSKYTKQFYRFLRAERARSPRQSSCAVNSVAIELANLLTR